MANAPGQGRKPKPTALKILAGNPGQRPINLREPKPRARLPRPPAELSDAAKKEWRSLGRKLLNLGIISEIDVGAFAVFCQAWARWLDAEANLTKYGPVLTVKGGLRLSPYIRIAESAMAYILKAGPEFGLTPSSRVRLHVDKPTDEAQEEAARFLRLG